MSSAAFGELGLGPDASADEVRAARRRLAKAHHPDQGGDPGRMQAVNEAADAALRAVEQRTTAREAPAPRDSPAGGTVADVPWSRLVQDVPSFVVEALPTETFDGLLVVASWMGEVLDDDRPDALEVALGDPFWCWCRLDVVADGRAATVSLTVAGIGGHPTPDVIAVRDAWISNLNAIDWP